MILPCDHVSDRPHARVDLDTHRSKVSQFFLGSPVTAGDESDADSDAEGDGTGANENAENVDGDNATDGQEPRGQFVAGMFWSRGRRSERINFVGNMRCLLLLLPSVAMRAVAMVDGAEKKRMARWR